jgi:hypothetical protein
MAKIQLWRSVLESARERCASLTSGEQHVIDQLLGQKTDNITVDVDQLPAEFARSILEDAKLKPSHRAALALSVHGMQTGDAVDRLRLYSLEIANPITFASTLATFSRSQAAVELKWNNRWYPVVLRADINDDRSRQDKQVYLRATLGLGATTHELTWPIDHGLFLNQHGDPVSMTMLEVFEKLGFRSVQTSPGAYNLRLSKAERFAAQHGLQVWVKGNVLDVAHTWFGVALGELPLGTPEVPRRAVVEPTFDADSRYGGFYRAVIGESVSRLPLVRVFSLDSKRYVFVDVDDLDEYEYDEASLDRLYLPTEMKAILTKVFETPQDQLFGDLVRGKHGGIVILACGGPGVGKTLTAEVYAEMTRRPLYVLEFGEMGTRVEQIEENLQRVFARVVRWRAVLQFDECDVFLGNRSLDLERSAIVGIFLRLLDYYEGLLFLTTNRASALDDAIRSRIMLKLEYPDLDDVGRAVIWKTMFAAAGLSLASGSFESLAKLSPVNGRQIRNLVRLTRILHPNGTVSVDDVAHLHRYGSA